MKRKLSVPLLLILASSLFLVFNFTVQPTQAVFGPEDIFFEYGAESGELQPPWDFVGASGTGSTTGAGTEISSSQTRTGTKSVRLFQPALPKSDAQRRVEADWYSHTKTEFYWSFWAYFPTGYDTVADNADWLNIGGLTLYWGDDDNDDGRRWSKGLRSRFTAYGNATGLYARGTWTANDRTGDWVDFWYNGDLHALTLNTWHHFQIYMKVHQTAGIVQTWIDNVENLALTGQHTDPAYWSEPEVGDSWSHGNEFYSLGITQYGDQDTTDALEVWYDDVVASDEKVSEAYGVGYTSLEFENWEDGFESGNFSAWNNTHYAGGGVAPSVTSTYAYTDTYAANFTTDGADDSYADAMHIIQDASEVYQRSYVRFEDLPDANNTRLMVMRMERASTYITAVGVYKLGANFYWCIDITGGAVNPPENYTLATIAADTWYAIEFYFNSTTNGNATLWVNNVLQCEETGDYSGHGDLQQVYPYLYVEGAQGSAKMVYHDNYRVDDVRIGGGTPEIFQALVFCSVIGENSTGGQSPLQYITINGTRATGASGIYEWGNLTYNTAYTFIIGNITGYYPAWVLNVDGDYNWNGTNYILHHTVTETQSGYVELVFVSSSNEPYIQEVTGTITSASFYYSSASRNVYLTMSGATTNLIETRERFTPSYYDITGATDWFWSGLAYTFEVQGTSAVTVEWR